MSAVWRRNSKRISQVLKEGILNAANLAGFHLRYQNLSESGVNVRIEEDTTDDTEVNHTDEVVSFLAIEGNGVLTGKAYVPSGTIERKYYFLGGQRVAMREAGDLFYLLSDHLGSTTITTDENGEVSAEMHYTAWGETRYKEDHTPTGRRFTGQIQEPEIGLYFYNARWYDPYIIRLTHRIVQIRTRVAYLRPACLITGLNLSDRQASCLPHRNLKPGAVCQLWGQI